MKAMAVKIFIVLLFGFSTVLGYSVRTIGLGGSGVSLLDDLNALRINPAGLVFLPEDQLALNIGKNYFASEDGFIVGADYARPVKNLGALGGYVMRESYDEIDTETTISFVLGRTEKKYGFSWGGNLGGVFGGAGRVHILLGAGARYRVGKFNLGLMAHNIVSKTRRAQFGVSRRFDDLIFSLDFDTNSELYLGGEYEVYHGLGKLRAGINTAMRSFSIGFGAYLWPYGLDVAWRVPWENRNDGTFMFSLIYRFGGYDFSQTLLTRSTEKAASLERRSMELRRNIEVLSDELLETKAAYREAKDLVDILDAEASAMIKRKIREGRGDTPPPKEIMQREPAPARPREPSRIKPALPVKHRVMPGDSLRSLSQKYYGNPDRWQIIYSANRDKIERGLPRIGVDLMIPEPSE